MKKPLNSLTTNRQQGQFVINVAEVLVSAGLVIAGAFQAQMFWQDYQHDSYYKELKRVETSLWDYKAMTGHWPADCNGDGTIDIGRTNNGGADEPLSSCAFELGSQDAIMQVINDFAEVNLLDDSIKQAFANEGKPRMQLAHAKLKEQEHNVLVAFDVSPSLAKWLDIKIDGNIQANNGRIRLWDKARETVWPQSSEMKTITIAYYFDSKI